MPSRVYWDYSESLAIIEFNSKFMQLLLIILEISAIGILHKYYIVFKK